MVTWQCQLDLPIFLIAIGLAYIGDFDVTKKTLWALRSLFATAKCLDLLWSRARSTLWLGVLPVYSPVRPQVLKTAQGGGPRVPGYSIGAVKLICYHNPSVLGPWLGAVTAQSVEALCSHIMRWNLGQVALGRVKWVKELGTEVEIGCQPESEQLN